MQELLAFWARVRVAVGPHGGALANVMFMPRGGAALVELFPVDPVTGAPLQRLAAGGARRGWARVCMRLILLGHAGLLTFYAPDHVARARALCATRHAAGALHVVSGDLFALHAMDQGKRDNAAPLPACSPLCAGCVREGRAHSNVPLSGIACSRAILLRSHREASMHLAVRQA